MVAGGLTFAVPGMVPEAQAANANLFVSAEQAKYSNYMSGPQVIEVVIIDSDINDTDEDKGEPDVTVNGSILRMVQATDGNWYGYFADRAMAQEADETVLNTNGNRGTGLDFGTFCGSGSTAFSSDGTPLFTDTVGIAIANYTTHAVGTASMNGTDGKDQIINCNTPALASNTGNNPDARQGIAMNVLREAKDVNNNQRVDVGQIGLASPHLWPFIQLYNLNPTGNVEIVYNKGGGVQSTTLTFDTVDQFAGLELDRSTYPLDAQIHATITDPWLNIDPTDEDSWTFGTSGTVGTYYQVFDENGAVVGNTTHNTGPTLTNALGDLMCDDNCVMKTDPNAQDRMDVFTLQGNTDAPLNHTGDGTDPKHWFVPQGMSGENRPLHGNIPITITEQGPNSGVFGTYDESDNSVIRITSDAARGTSATIDYNDTPKSIVVGHVAGEVEIRPIDATWNSGEEIPVVIIDNDANKNTRADEDLLVTDPNTAIPALRTGDPFTLDEGDNGNVTASVYAAQSGGSAIEPNGNVTVDPFSKVGIMDFGLSEDAIAKRIVIDGTTVGELKATLLDTRESAGDDRLHGFTLLNVDFRSLSSDVKYKVALTGLASAHTVATNLDPQDLELLAGPGVDSTAEYIALLRALGTASDATAIALEITATTDTALQVQNKPIVLDIFSFGFTGDGVKASDRVSNQIVRIEAEEAGDNTSIFEGTLEYVMLNQLNILEKSTYEGLATISSTASFIVMEDLTDEDAPRVNYLDLDGQGVKTQVADQEEAPSHSGVVSFDANSYKIADTVTVTVEDFDLNTNSDTVEIYTIVTASGNDNEDVVGTAKPADLNVPHIGQLLEITFDDKRWTADANGCGVDTNGDQFKDTGFTLEETEAASGIFVGTFQIPAQWCNEKDAAVTTTGKDIEVNYVDFRDASGEIIEVGDSAGVRANTGSVSLDRTVYPVPFGVPSDFVDDNVNSTSTSPDGRSIFPIHATGINRNAGESIALSTDPDKSIEHIDGGDLTVHIRVNDPDFDLSASGEDKLAYNLTKDIAQGVGPVKISVMRGSDEVVLAYAGGLKAEPGHIGIPGVDREKIANGATTSTSTPFDITKVREMGPINEIAPDAGIFEIDFTIRYTDGPASTDCPVTRSWTATDGSTGKDSNDEDDRFWVNATSGDYCILQGDILQVEYTDPADASGNDNSVTDSATFDLRNGVLQADKSAYIIGSDMILTLIEPDLDLNNDAAETYTLDLIEWDSDAAAVSMGPADGQRDSFDPEPTELRETGDSTGIFQIVVEIPEELDNDRLERGEEIVLEYTDWGPSGSDYVGDEDEDVNVTVYTSNFGATVELDQKVYSWTDKVYITIVAPDHNFDGDLVDEIGGESDPIKVSTRSADIEYKLVETGTDTGIFTGEVILTGFPHDADGDGTDENEKPEKSDKRAGPTDGKLPTEDDDGLTVSFEFSEDETIVGSALIRWNIGEVQWLEASYPASGTGVIRVIDPDMNLNPEAVDNFDVDVWSDSDAGGVDMTVTETNEATGIFEGTVFFTTTDESSGHRLRVAEGDTVTARYTDHTLPDPHTTADEIPVTATSLIGTIVPPLERVPATNLRIVDAFGNSLDTVSVDQQVQISADIANGQDRDQPFAYLVQVQDADGVTVELDWIASTLVAGQASSQASSWTPAAAGAYTITAFVWESTDNPTALSPPVEITVNVN